MKARNKRNRSTLALAGAVLLLAAGMGESAMAVTFGQGDLLLTIHGNRTPGEGKEAVINLSQLLQVGGGAALGNFNNLAAIPSTVFTHDVSQFLNSAGIIDTNPADPAFPVRFSIYGFQQPVGSDSLPYLVGSANTLTGSQFTSGNFVTA